MTTTTTGTTGPQAWKIALVAGAVGLAALVVANLPQSTSDTTGQQVVETATATLPDSMTGFDYSNESTQGKASSPGVTTQYTGNSGELFPYENGSAPAQAPTGFGGPTPQAASDQATIDAQAPVITQEFLDGSSSTTQGAGRIDLSAATAAGLIPGAIDAIVGGTTRVAPLPDNLADAQDRAAAAQSLSQKSVVEPEAATNATWGALREAHHNGTISSYYVPAEPNPADVKFLEGRPEVAPEAEPQAPMTNNQLL